MHVRSVTFWFHFDVYVCVCIYSYICLYKSVCGQNACQKQHDITLPDGPTRPAVNDYPQSPCIPLMGIVLTTPESLAVALMLRQLVSYKKEMG